MNNNENTKISFWEKLKAFKAKHSAVFNFIYQMLMYGLWFYFGYQVGIQG